jgi:hypothetical protein
VGTCIGFDWSGGAIFRPCAYSGLLASGFWGLLLLLLGESAGLRCSRCCTEPWYPAECPAAVSLVADGSAAVALGLAMAFSEVRRTTLRSPAAWGIWPAGPSPAGPLEGLLPIEGGVAVGGWVVVVVGRLREEDRPTRRLAWVSIRLTASRRRREHRRGSELSFDQKLRVEMMTLDDPIRLGLRVRAVITRLPRILPPFQVELRSLIPSKYFGFGEIQHLDG